MIFEDIYFIMKKFILCYAVTFNNWIEFLHYLKNVILYSCKTIYLVYMYISIDILFSLDFIYNFIFFLIVYIFSYFE